MKKFSITIPIKDKYTPIYPINEKVKVRYTPRVGNNRVF